MNECNVNQTEVVKALKGCVFIIESLAHLQCKEQEILPWTEYVRELIIKVSTE